MFRRERGRLWKIARHHYFEVLFQPMRNQARFASGWYEPQIEGMNESRWMAAQSTTILPPASARQRLRLRFHVPAALRGSAVTISLNGKVVDRIGAESSDVSREYEVDGDVSNVLELSIDRTIEEAGRPHGLRLHSLGWGPASS